MATIFLSHSSRNDALASALEKWLISNGFDDLFVDHDAIRAGDKWTEALRRAKGSCRVVLCLVTPEWLASDECYGEFTAGWYAGRRMIPLLAVTGASLDTKQKGRLGRVLGEDQGVDIAKAGAPDSLELDAYPDIADPLKAGLRAAGALAKVGLDPYAFEIDRDKKPEPFPGLESFADTDADASIFFGRSPEIAQCLEDLREMRASGDRRAYAILGGSGSGKSSLMKAGLLPRLRRERGWLALRAFRPGADPLLNFASAIARTANELGESKSPGGVRDALFAAYRESGDLRAALDAQLKPLKLKADRVTATVLISVDQGEELTRADGESGDALGAYLKVALAEAAEDEPAAYAVVLTVRSDSFPELQQAKRFEGLTTRTADIRTLPVYRFDNAIEQPAARYGVEIEPELIEALMEDAGGKDALPLLAFTLQRLWRQYEAEKRIRKANYDSVGKLSGLLEDAAERALRGIDPSASQGPLDSKVPASKEKAAAHIFVPALAQVNEHGAAIRRVASNNSFDESAQEILKAFDQWRLVVKSGDQVEVAHEAMFREWPRFKRWLEPEKARLETLRGVESAATSWAAKGRNTDDLIHAGRRLRAARRLDDFDEFKTLLDRAPDCRDYIKACKRHVASLALIGRYAAITLPIQAVIALCSMSAGYLLDGATALPAHALTGLGSLIMYAPIGVGLFGCGVLVRSLAKRLRVNFDLGTIGVAILFTIALVGFQGFSLFANSSVEQLGQIQKNAMLQQPNGGIWRPYYEAASNRALGYGIVGASLSASAAYFSLGWTALNVLVIVVSPIFILIRVAFRSIFSRRQHPHAMLSPAS